MIRQLRNKCGKYQKITKQEWKEFAREGEQLDFELQGSVAGDLRRAAVLPIGHLGGDREERLLSLLHGGDALAPAGDNTFADFEAEWLPTVHTRVEFRTVQ